jgi:hypothetical protein
MLVRFLNTSMRKARREWKAQPRVNITYQRTKQLSKHLVGARTCTHAFAHNHATIFYANPTSIYHRSEKKPLTISQSLRQYPVHARSLERTHGTSHRNKKPKRIRTTKMYNRIETKHPQSKPSLFSFPFPKLTALSLAAVSSSNASFFRNAS